MRSISCPFCGVRSTIALDIPTTEARSWTQDCPVCGRTWAVKVWLRRGIPELNVEPVIGDAKTVASKPKPKPKPKPKAKKRIAKKPAAKRAAKPRTRKTKKTRRK